MKTTTHNIATWKTTIVLQILGLILAGSSSQPCNAATTDPYPMCAKFVGDQTHVGSDGLGVYCQAGDVLCGSDGQGFVLTTDYPPGPAQRKAWIDLKNAVQYNSPLVPAKSLPRGMQEVEMFGMYPNNPDGTCIPGPEGRPLDMVPGEMYLSALRIRIFDGKNWFDLRFGQVNCEAVPSPCPVLLTAGADLDNDGLADIWTIEPSTPDATAILFKGKPNYNVPPGTVIGAFRVPFRLIFVREQFSAVLDSIS